MVLTKNISRKAALRFLQSGDDGGADMHVLVMECDRVVRQETEKSSASAVRLGRRFVDRVRPYQGGLLATALRAYGWALLVSGKYTEAKKAYLEARALMRRDVSGRARIDRVLIDVYMYLGDFKEAQRRVRLAMAAFKKSGDEAEAAKTRINHANLLHRQDRHHAAGKLYREAGEFFENQGAELLVAFCHYNEANTLVQLFDFRKATSLYRKARQIFLRHDYDLRANGCQYGLAWLHMLEGNYHIALQELTGCEQDYRKASQPREVVLCLLDRAEAYLGLNLFVDARNAARTAEKRANKLGIRYESAKAALFMAKASVAMGRNRDARRALTRAEAGFREEKNRPFLAAAQLLAAQIEPKSDKRTARIKAAQRSFAQAQLPLWEAICDLQFLSEWSDDASVFRRLAMNPAVKTVPHLYAHYQTILGDREAGRGRMAKANGHWTRAADVLDAVRAKLPPVDLRSAFSRHQSDPYRKLINSELKRDPVCAAAWSERFKTAGLWTTSGEAFQSSPIRARAEQSLDRLAGQVTALSGRLGDATGKRMTPDTQAGRALLNLQKQVRSDLAAVDKRRKARADRIETLREKIALASDRQPVIQFHLGGDDMVAFLHHRRSTRVYRYVDGARKASEFVGRWRFLVERAPSVNGNPRPADLADERRLLEQIGEWLFSPLEIPSKQRRILILPEGHLANMPWQAIVRGGQPLAESFEIILSPSLRHYLHARKQRVSSEQIRVFVGTTEGLTQPEAEYSLLLDEARGKVTVHDPCRRDEWPSDSQARLWHYVGHAELRNDNPFYSSLLLADGPLFAADFRLKKNRVGLVTLAACRTGQQTSLPGEESTGFVRSMLEMGARNVIASHWAIHDRSTLPWMSHFYRCFLGGQSVGQAVRQAALETREHYPSACHWAAFSVFGAG